MFRLRSAQHDRESDFKQALLLRGAKVQKSPRVTEAQRYKRTENVGKQREKVYLCEDKQKLIAYMASIDLQLQQTVLQDVVSIMGDNDLLRKLHKYLQKLKKEETTEESDVMTEADKREILGDIKEALRELRTAQKKNVQLQSARDFLHEIRS